MTNEVEQFERLIAVIEELAGGNLDARFPISPGHDDYDAIGFGVNCLADELTATIKRLEKEAAQRRSTETELEASERRQQEIREELRNHRTARLASIGSLAAGVGHEINNPLTYVLANLDAVRVLLGEIVPIGAGEPTREIDAMLSETREGAERIRRIVQDLRLFSRVDDESEESVDVCEVMDSALALAGNEIRDRARLERCYRDVPRIVASEPRLVHVFVNLLIYSAHSIPVGEASRQVICVTIERSGEDAVSVEIADTGAGVREDDLGRVFDSFDGPGYGRGATGLDLAICREVVWKMGGSIAVESGVAIGKTFRLSLPIGDALATAAQPAASAHAAIDRAKPRALIIDDDQPVATALARLLFDADATIAGGGLEALGLLRGDVEFDVIFCDLMMPGMSGMEVYETITEEAPELASRFIFVTGGAFTQRANRFLSSVSNPCLLKPFDLDELERIFAECVSASGR